MPAATQHPLVARTLAGLLLVLACLEIGWALAGRSTLALLVVGLMVAAALVLVVAELGVVALLVWAPLSVAAFPISNHLSSSPIATFDRAWVGAMAILLVVLPATTRSSRASRRVMIALGVFAAIYGLRAATTSADALYALRVWIDALVLPLVLFLVVRRVVVLDPRRSDSVALSLVVAGGLMAAVGVAERIFGFELATLSGSQVRLEEALGIVRISGPYDVPETYGLSLVLCLAATVYWMQRRGGSAYLVGGSVAALELAAILFTFFRVAWACAAIVIIVAFAFRPRQYARTVLVAAGLGIALAVVVAALGQSSSFSGRAKGTENLSSRLGSYKQAVEIWREDPVFGVGVERYQAVAEARPPVQVDGVNSQPNPHSSFFGALAELGAVGFAALLYLGFAIWGLVHALNARRRAWPEIVLAAAVSGATASYLLFSLTLGMLPYSPSNLFFAMLLGLAAAHVDLVDAAARGTDDDAEDAAPNEVAQSSTTISPPRSRAHAGVAR